MKGDYRICLIFLVSILTSWIKIVRSLLFKCLKDGGWVREFCDAQEVKHWFQKNLKKVISKPLLMNRYLPWSWLLSRIPASLSTVASISSNQAQILLFINVLYSLLFSNKNWSKMMDGHDNEDEDDILPDTDIDRERTLAGKWALFVLVNNVWADKIMKSFVDF